MAIVTAGMAALLALPSLGAGCGTSAANVAEVDTETGSSSHLIGDSDLYDDIGIKDIRTRTNEETNFLEVQCTLINKTDDRLRFEYKFEWYDETGFLIQSTKENWRPKQIIGHERLPLAGVSPDPRAKSFKVAVRRPQEIK